MGALEFEPELPAPDETKAIELEKLVAVSKDIESNRYDFRLSAYEDDVINLLYKLGTSAGGKRPKAIIAIDYATKEIRSGQIPLPDNFVYCIIKFNVADEFPFTKVEAAYYRMATAAGITMMPSSLIEIGGEQHFITERFDRKAGGAKVFTQTLSAVNPSASSYEDLFRTARKLGVPQKKLTNSSRGRVQLPRGQCGRPQQELLLPDGRQRPLAHIPGLRYNFHGRTGERVAELSLPAPDGQGEEHNRQ